MHIRYQSLLWIVAALFLALFVYLSVAKVQGVQDGTITIVVGGDVMLGRTVMTRSLDMTDPTYPWKYTYEYLKSADLTFFNLENPIVENCPRHTTGFKFCADPEMISGLTFAGVDIVSLANNHSRNYGETGIFQTKKYLTDNGIAYTDHQLTVKEVGGVKFGFVGLNLVDKTAVPDSYLQEVSRADSLVDVLIVAPHWGYEYQAKASKYQVAMATSLVEHGADLIVGAHPHWVQNTEVVGGKPVYYSLGNFIFDQMWSEETKKGLVVEFTFDKQGKLLNEKKLPTYMQNWAQPRWK